MMFDFLIFNLNFHGISFFFFSFSNLRLKNITLENIQKCNTDEIKGFAKGTCKVSISCGKTFKNYVIFILCAFHNIMIILQCTRGLLCAHNSSWVHVLSQTALWAHLIRFSFDGPPRFTVVHYTRTVSLKCLIGWWYWCTFQLAEHYAIRKRIIIFSFGNH